MKNIVCNSRNNDSDKKKGRDSMRKKHRVRLFGILLTLLIFTSATTVIAAGCKTHSYLAWKTAQNASCTATGLKTRQCKNCGVLQKSTIPKLGHSTVTRTVISPTCQKAGKKESSCVRCGKLISTASIPKTAHKYVGYRATTSAEKKKYGWSSISFCKYCGKASGSVANY